MTNKHNIRYIVVHSTSSSPKHVPLLESLPYHFLITNNGRLQNLHPVKSEDGCVDVAYVGGIDKKGGIMDTRTPMQCESLFNTLILLSEQFPDARIVSASELFGIQEDPGFNVKDWLGTYIPSMLIAA